MSDNYQQQEQDWDGFFRMPTPEESKGNFEPFEMIPEDAYVLEFTNYTKPSDSPFQNVDKKTGEVLPPSKQTQVTWTIVRADDDKLVGRTFTQWYKVSLHPESNLYPVVKALMGGEIAPDHRVDPRELKGRLLKGTVEWTEEKWGPNDDRSKPGKRYHRLKAPLAYRGPAIDTSKIDRGPKKAQQTPEPPF